MPMNENEPLSPHQSIVIEEVEHGGFFAGDLFRRKFGDDPPSIPRHVVAFAKPASGGVAVAAYLHLWRFEQVYMVGGLCVDGAVLRALPEEAQAAIRAVDGLAYFLLRYGFTRMTDCNAWYGYVGDARALQVDLRAGFERTDRPLLVARYNRAFDDAEREQLTRRIEALGPF
jgi:hypothetical protein